MPRLALYLLGPPRVELEGEPVHIGRRKAVALLAYLAVEPSHHSRDALATLLWPEFDQQGARGQLRRCLSVLNRTLGEGWQVAGRDTAGLNPQAGLWLDVDEFRQLLAACEAHVHPTHDPCPDCLARLIGAVELYRDGFMSGFTLPDSLEFDEWQRYQAERLRDELATVLGRLAAGHGSQGDYEPAIAYARRWVELDPLRERAHQQLMDLYAQAGRHTAALRQYRACMRVLEQELGVPPSAETTALYERIRSERTQPVAPQVGAPRPTRPRIPTPGFLSDKAETVVPERPVFVARERELARLDGHLQTARQGQGQVVFVTGGPGRGKTALLREFAWRAMDAHADLLLASGVCDAYSGIGDPFLPFRQILAMLTGDVETQWTSGAISREHAQRLWATLPLTVKALLDQAPNLIDVFLFGPTLLSRAAASAPQTQDWLAGLRSRIQREKGERPDLEQRHLFEQYTNVLGALACDHPLLLLLDNLQWADAPSVALLFHLGLRLADAGGQILVVGAYRPEEVAIDRAGTVHPLAPVLSEFKRRFGDVWLDLARVDILEGRGFVDGIVDTESNRLGERFRKQLFKHTGGHPLFTVELLRSMQERGDLIQDEAGCWTEGPALHWDELPARVESVIEARVDRLDDELRDILGVASVAGEAFTAQVVAQLQGIPERKVVRTLSQELGARHRLVQAQGEVQINGIFLSRFQFSHALFRAYVYNTLSPGERRLLHGETAIALEELYGAQTEKIAVQLARHYDEAGIPDKAIDYLLKSGNSAHRAFANEEAVRHYRRALKRLDASRWGESRKDWRLEAFKGLGVALLRTGDLGGAEDYLRRAIAYGREMGCPSPDLARLHFWLMDVLTWQDRVDEVIEAGEQGLALLGEEDESIEAALINQHIALAYAFKGDWDRFRQFTGRSVEFIRNLPYSDELGSAYIIIASHYYLYSKQVDDAMDWLQALKRRATLHRDLRALADADVHGRLILFHQGDYRGAISGSQRGLEMATKIGDAVLELFFLALNALTLLSQGKLQKANDFTDRLIETAKGHGGQEVRAWAYERLGTILLCQGACEEASSAAEKAIHLSRELPPILRPHKLAWTARIDLAVGKREEALTHFQEAIALMEPDHVPPDAQWTNWRPRFADALSGLEEAYDKPNAFQSYCRRIQKERPEITDSAFIQWHLAAADVETVDRSPLHRDAFADELSSGWLWTDLFDDCSFSLHDGLELHAANGRDLWHINLSAPRLLRNAPKNADWAVQTVCRAASADRPAIGGVLLWKDQENYLRLDRGTAGEREIAFHGCRDNQDLIIGRGRFSTGSSERVFLRIERIADRVNALCSADGVDWFTVGHVDFPVEDPLQIGLHAIGNIDRTIYHDAYADGTAVRFESFTVWELER
jgi:DNA-binding SARP family transcriptional activator